MDLIITLLNGESYSLTVHPETTVKSLKSLIDQKFKVPIAKQKLLTENGRKIFLEDDSKKLSFYGLRFGSTVCVLIQEPSSMQVFLKNEKGQLKTYDVFPGETVNQFKVKVFQKEGVPVDQQRLIHEGKQMEDGAKLEDYNVRSQSTIFLTLRLRGG
ncbi:polyubiquitin-like [Aplochiton taeniatus]